MSTYAFNSDRLTIARKKRGLTKSTLANIIKVDLRTISAYEAGEYEPKPEKLRHICQALRFDANYFFKAHLGLPEPRQASFRALSKMSAMKRDIALANAAIAFDVADYFENQFNLPPVAIPDLSKYDNPEDASYSLRQIWELGEQPINNLIHLLESKGVLVFSLSIDSKDVDAFCLWNDDRPFVFLNTKKSAAHSRFDGAHELGHLVLHRHGDYDGRTTEKEANDFASAFLMPRDGFSATAPRFSDLSNIIVKKKRWGVSVAAYVVRLFKLGLISEWHYRMLFKQISQRGYRTNEPDDARRENSQLISIILSDLRDEGIGIPDISKFLGVDQQDVAEILFDLAIFHVEGGVGIQGGRLGLAGGPKLIVDNESIE